MDPALLLLGLILVLANTVEAVTGFGSTILALTFAAHLYGIDFLVPVLVPINVVLSIYLVARYHAAIDRRELLTRILPLAGAGLPIGYALFRVLGTGRLRHAYGAFVVAIAVFQLARLLARKNGEADSPRPGLARAAGLLVAGGIMQGIYASGGPLVVLYAGRALGDKRAFRSTLSALWLVLNLVLVAGHAVGGTLNLHTLAASALLLPSLAVGLALGEWLHDRIDERRFRVVVFALLVLAGSSLLLKG